MTCLVEPIHSRAFVGFFGSSGRNSELSHDRDSGLFFWTTGGLGEAYNGTGFGSFFFSPIASPVLLKKFLVPEATLSHVRRRLRNVL